MSGFRPLLPALPLVVMAWRVRSLIHAFIAAGAVSQERAVAPSSLQIRTGSIFRRLVRRGVLVPVGSDRYYLDESRYRQWRAARRKRALIVIGLIVVVISVFYWFSAR